MDKLDASTKSGWLAHRWERALRVIAIPLCLWLVLYGAGTTAGLLGPTRLPANIAAPAIRSDMAGWLEFAAEVILPADEIPFAVDYSIAGQMAHYSGRQVYSAHPQFRLWGLPDINNLTVLSQEFIPPEVITERLLADFSNTSGPGTWHYEAAGVNKTVYIWHARGLRVAVARVLDDLDFLRLAQDTERRLR